MNCCDKQEWVYVSDAGHSDGCEYTLGKCNSCGKNLINLYVAASGTENVYVIVSQDFVSKINSLEGKALKKFMSDWYNEL